MGGGNYLKTKRIQLYIYMFGNIISECVFSQDSASTVTKRTSYKAALVV